MKYVNPIIRGFNPDPSVVRVEEDYYLVTSSFEYFPGIPIYHSRDLLNWEQIGNCIGLENPLPLKDAKDSGGIWAPTIRYNQGTFYVTATLDGFGNFIIFSKWPDKGWSKPVKVTMGGIDPSLFFEDGKAYYCTNHRVNQDREEISMAVVNPETGELLSEIRPLWEGTGGGYMEAPHVYRVGRWYYLLTAEGGTNFNHMVTIARSEAIWGPYESGPHNPILSNRHDTSKQVQCTGHGDLVADQHENWWMVHLGTRLSRRTMTNLGRETFLSPVKWRDGWPVAGVHGQAVIEGEGPLWETQKEKPVFRPDFSKPDWEPQWLFLREPRWQHYERGQGKLRLYPAKDFTFAALRPRDFECTIQAAFKFEPQSIGDEAGLMVYLAADFHYRFMKTRQVDGDYVVLEKTAEDFSQTAFMQKIGLGKVTFKLMADKEYYHFYFALGNEPLEEKAKASTRFLSCEVAGRCFTGTVMGVYGKSLGETSAFMEIDDFLMD